MHTFLDNTVRHHTFIIYGDLTDDIWCPDLMRREWEQYLVKLLKSKGYKHIIFYGEAGTRGAYCLDPESVRFFFGINEGVPMPEPVDGVIAASNSVFAAVSHPEDATTQTQAKQKISSSMRKYAKKKTDVDESIAERDNQGNQENSNVISVRYSFKKYTPETFMTLISPKMEDNNSRMAVVFYNIFTTDMVQNKPLKDSIMTGWENSRNKNLCLLMGPQTVKELTSLISKLSHPGESGYESMFLVRSDNGELQPNPDNCIRVGGPEDDEVQYMLRYLSIVGTDKGNRIKFPYTALRDIAQRILYHSHCSSMSEIYHKVSSYIDDNNVGGYWVISLKEHVDAIWGFDAPMESAIKQLDRPGWEPAYREVSNTLKAIKKQRVRMMETAQPIRSKPEWTIKRLGISSYNKQPYKIPNFVIMGNPGTGKTTISRIIGKVLREEGILQKGHFVEVGQQQLTNIYRSGARQETARYAEKAEGGVLFIDEAHSLGTEDGGAHSSSTGKEIVSTLNQIMTDSRHHLSVILGGYKEGMDKVWNIDPGFKGRFGINFITLEDYSPNLLTDILVKVLLERKYELDEALLSEKEEKGACYVPLKCMIKRLYAERNRETFRNADEMNALADAIDSRCVGNVVHQNDFYGVFKDSIITEDWFRPLDTESSVDQILGEMDRRFVGMEEVKKQLEVLGNEIEEAVNSKQSLEKIRLWPIIFAGNPGTGKSTVIDYVAKMYHHYGLLGTAKPIKINASELASKYQGGSQEKINEYIKRAQNQKALLFVDEAHQLLNAHFDGQGAFQSFMAPLTDMEHPFLACFGMYSDKVDSFLALDPGAFERITTIQLEDYTGSQLYEIMQMMIRKQEKETDDETNEMLRRILDWVYETRTKTTGNGRKVERILKEMDDNRRARCKKSGIQLGSKESKKYTVEDIPEKFRNKVRTGNNLSRIEQLEAMKKELQEKRIGCEDLKNVLYELTDSMISKEKYPRGRSGNPDPGHYFFVGNPGTGKTTSVQVFAKYLYDLGLVTDPKPIVISSSRLIAGYVGQTAEKTRDKLESSVGHVLMIDEAYSLYEEDPQGASFKQDAIDEIIYFLDNEQFRKTTSVIFAGYVNDMKNLYHMNDGLKSRIKKEIYFSDFTIDQCMMMLRSMLQEKEITIEEEAEKVCEDQIRRMKINRSFGNGRTVRKYADLLIAKVNQRSVLKRDEYEEDDPRAYQVLTEDVPEFDDVLTGLNLV